MLVAHLIEPQTHSTVDAVKWIARHPDRANVAKISSLLATPFLVATAGVYVLLSRRRSTRLAYAGGLGLAIGMVGLAAVEGYETLAYALAQDPRFDPAALADVIDRMSSPPTIAMGTIFLPFTLFGLLASAAALWRSDAVPRGAILLIPTFLVVDLSLNESFALVPPVAGPAILFLAACWIAWSMLAAGRPDARSRVERRAFGRD
ncbi:MAG: hypothetical protein ACJ79V_04360 [Myxococcales bacterium]